MSEISGIVTYLTDREAQALILPWWRLMFAPQATWRARDRARHKIADELKVRGLT